eukprot:NODE_4_length_55019_cov_0.425091.p17 type:complete len:344 gc:universal NODE_4_length_55019_cov_0.425091:8566-7535(-)
MTITSWSYTFLSLPGSPGYLMFNPPLKYSNISCTLSAEYESSILSCTATHEDSGSLSTQIDEVNAYCQESCHNAIKAFSSCLTRSGSDGSLLLRYWDSGCMTSPSDTSKNCLVERMKLLKEKGSDYTVLSNNTEGSISCNACTRVSMAKMIENYDYLKGKAEFANNMPSPNAVSLAKDNIQEKCGKSYSELELSEGGNSSPQELPIYAIVLMIVAAVLLVVGIAIYLFKRKSRKREEVQAFSSSYNSLQPSSDSLRDNYNGKPTYYDNAGYGGPNPYASEFIHDSNYGQPANLPQPRFSNLDDSTLAQTTSDQTNISNDSRQQGIHSFQDAHYDNMRVTAFDK